MLIALGMIAFGIGLVGMSLLVFYGWPRETRLGTTMRSRVVYHQLRTGMFIAQTRTWPTMLPFGLALVFIGIRMATELLPGVPYAIGDISMVIGMIAFVAAFALFVYTPRRLLPAWFVEENRRRKAGIEPGMPPPPEGPVPVMTSRQWLLSYVTIAVLSGIYLFLGWPIQYLLFGLAGGLSVLAVTKTKR
jgi:hypothetical protein